LGPTWVPACGGQAKRSERDGRMVRSMELTWWGMRKQVGQASFACGVASRAKDRKRPIFWSSNTLNIRHQEEGTSNERIRGVCLDIMLHPRSHSISTSPSLQVRQQSSPPYEEITTIWMVAGSCDAILLNTPVWKIAASHLHPVLSACENLTASLPASSPPTWINVDTYRSSTTRRRAY
jgi:hypothetical protein